MPMPTRAATILLATVVLLAGACAADEPDTQPTSVPTPGPTTTVPDAELEIDLEGFLACLDEGGIDVEPEEDPRFEANAEVQITLLTSEGPDNVGIFIYDSAEDAEAGKESLDDALRAFDSPPSQQVGNVLISGLLEVVQDPDAQENVGVLLGCLGGFDVNA